MFTSDDIGYTIPIMGEDLSQTLLNLQRFTSTLGYPGFNDSGRVVYFYMHGSSRDRRTYLDRSIPDSYSCSCNSNYGHMLIVSQCLTQMFTWLNHQYDVEGAHWGINPQTNMLGLYDDSVEGIVTTGEGLVGYF